MCRESQPFEQGIQLWKVLEDLPTVARCRSQIHFLILGACLRREYENEETRSCERTLLLLRRSVHPAKRVSAFCVLNASARKLPCICGAQIVGQHHWHAVDRQHNCRILWQCVWKVCHLSSTFLGVSLYTSDALAATSAHRCVENSALSKCR